MFLGCIVEEQLVNCRGNRVTWLAYFAPGNRRVIKDFFANKDYNREKFSKGLLFPFRV